MGQVASSLPGLGGGFMGMVPGLGRQVSLPVNVTKDLNHGGQLLVTGTISIAEHDIKAEQKRVTKVRRERRR